MRKFITNTILLISILVLSYYTAEYFGGWYDKLAPLYDRSLFPISKEGLIFLVGLPLAYTFFTILLFQIFDSGRKMKWTLWLLLPALLFFAAGDLKHIYIPIIVGLIGFGLAKIINFILSRSRHHNYPMVTKR